MRPVLLDHPGIKQASQAAMRERSSSDLAAG
jgi:hypothetical protein